MDALAGLVDSRCRRDVDGVMGVNFWIGNLFPLPPPSPRVGFFFVLYFSLSLPLPSQMDGRRSTRLGGVIYLGTSLPTYVRVEVGQPLGQMGSGKRGFANLGPPS